MAGSALPPRDQRYFEDYIPGLSFEFGPIALDEKELVDFAKRFDPQGMHTDQKAAASGPFGGLIASGWHTMALTMRLFVDHFVSPVAGLASPGVDEIRWRLPVRPGDALRIRVKVLEARRSRSKPDRGLLRIALDTINQKDEVVQSMIALNMLLLRNPNAPLEPEGRRVTGFGT